MTGAVTRSERGATSALLPALAAVLALVAVAAAWTAGTVVAHRAAQSAADLAALAGAGAVQRGLDGCAAAGRLATANDARVTGCHRVDRDLVVTVEVTGPGLWGRTPTLVGSARAGPAPAGPPP